MDARGKFGEHERSTGGKTMIFAYIKMTALKALVSSHINDLLTFEWTIEQSTETMPLTNQTIAATPQDDQ